MKEQILAVQRMQDYIEAHLEETVGLSDLAKVSLFSPWHSHRLFQEYTGLTPANYIRRLRLAKAALRIKNENVRIIDVAFDLGFGSVDGFTRAFFREFGICCQSCSHHSVRALRCKSQSTQKGKNDNENKQHFYSGHPQARPQGSLRGIKAENYFPYCEEVGCDVWGLLLSMDSLCGEPVSLWLAQQYKKPGTSTYVQGVEVDTDYHGAVPEGFDVIDLPEADYLMFQGEPFAEEDYCDAITAVQQAMDGYDPTVIGYVWDDSNPRIQLEPRGNRGYIELRSVCKK